MSGNNLILVCTPCSRADEPDYGFKLAIRTNLGAYLPFGGQEAPRQFTKWLYKHSKCGGKGHPDHFQLAHLAEPNYDQPQLKVAIEQALENGHA